LDNLAVATLRRSYLPERIGSILMSAWLTGCIHGHIVDAMLAIRTLLAILIAISLALVPAAAGAAFSLSSGETVMADHADIAKDALSPSCRVALIVARSILPRHIFVF
jgi:hypothetical protein